MEMEKILYSGAGAPSPSGFFFFCQATLFCKATLQKSVLYKKVLLWVVGGGGCTTIGTLDLKKSYHDSGPSPMRPNELWTCPDDGAARAQVHGCQRSS